MKYYIITGTSSGIGKALTEAILQEQDSKVIGISRKNVFENENYTHIFADLSETNFINKIEFPEINNNDEIVLINNAGIISEIKRIGDIAKDSIVNGFNVNTIAPLLLINKFIRKYQTSTSKKIILNISSGAGRHTVDAWTVYCASKAAMDMFSENINVEQQFIEENKRFRIYSVAPGVVNTQMQDFIRTAYIEDFSETEKFKNLKERNLLSQPKDIAEKLLELLSNNNLKEVILDIRKL